MTNVMRKLWNDEGGFIITVELILVATLLVIGLVSGLTMLRDSVLAELSDTAQAFGAIDQSWSAGGASYSSGTGVEASSASMAFTDAPDGADQSPSQGQALPIGGGLAVVTAPDFSADTLENGT